jgi:ribosomal protein L11 methyltransferase
LLNAVGDSVEIITDEIDAVKENEFDLILANIQKNVLLEIAEKIKMKIYKNGVVILSGLLDSDKIAIEKKYHSLGFKTEEVEQMDEWIAIVFKL